MRAKRREAVHERRVWYHKCRNHPEKRCRTHHRAFALSNLCAQCRHLADAAAMGQLSMFDKPAKCPNCGAKLHETTHIEKGEGMLAEISGPFCPWCNDFDRATVKAQAMTV